MKQTFKRWVGPLLLIGCCVMLVFTYSILEINTTDDMIILIKIIGACLSGMIISAVFILQRGER